MLIADVELIHWVTNREKERMSKLYNPNVAFFLSLSLCTRL